MVLLLLLCCWCSYRVIRTVLIGPTCVLMVAKQAPLVVGSAMVAYAMVA